MKQIVIRDVPIDTGGDFEATGTINGRDQQPQRPHVLISITGKALKTEVQHRAVWRFPTYFTA